MLNFDDAVRKKPMHVLAPPFDLDDACLLMMMMMGALLATSSLLVMIDLVSTGTWYLVLVLYDGTIPYIPYDTVQADYIVHQYVLLQKQSIGVSCIIQY